MKEGMKFALRIVPEIRIVVKSLSGRDLTREARNDEPLAVLRPFDRAHD